jgi:hypothetical protein
LHGRRIEPELFVQHLLEGGLVALALVSAAGWAGGESAYASATARRAPIVNAAS